MKIFYFVLCSFVLCACSKEAPTSEKAEAAPEIKTEISTPSVPTQSLRYAANDELFVLATSGLNLREKADANAAKITNVPYGSKVKVLAEDLGKTAYFVEEIKGFKIDGYWVKVDFGGKTGYLFDGFLSKWAAPKSEGYDFANYFDKMCKKVKSDKTKPKKANPQDADVFEYERIDYADGTQYTSQAYEGGGNDEIRFGAGKITFAEAFLLLKAFNRVVKMPTGKYDAAQKRISFESEMELNEVMEQNGQMVIKFSVAD